MHAYTVIEGLVTQIPKNYRLCQVVLGQEKWGI